MRKQPRLLESAPFALCPPTICFSFSLLQLPATDQELKQDDRSLRRKFSACELTEPVGKINEVAPTPIRLATSHFDTRTRGCHISAIDSDAVKSPVRHQQCRVPRLHDSACRELD